MHEDWLPLEVHCSISEQAFSVLYCPAQKHSLQADFEVHGA